MHPGTWSVADLRVLVLADDHLARAGLAAMLAAQPGCAVVGQVVGDEYASAATEPYRADVVVWDLGWDAAASIEHMAQTPDAGQPVVALVPDESQAAGAWAAGARGLLLRDAGGPTLLSALTSVAQGLAVLDPELSRSLFSPSAEGSPNAPASDLTRREMEVLDLVAEGLPNKTIALRLRISEHTVKFHVNSIFGKLGAQSRTEAVTRATRLGLILL